MGLSIGNRLLGSTGLSNGFGLSVGNGLSFLGFGGAFSPAILFANGEPGVWYDPSEMTTLFQDAAGTTPVTAVEQPVGRMLDKSGRGNHATQATPSARPVLSARVNLLTKTEQFNDAYWGTASRVTISANTTDTTDPLGGNTADKMVEVAATGTHRVSANGVNPAAVGVATLSLKTSVYFKKGSRNWAWINASDLGQNGATAWFDLNNGVVGTVSVVGAGSGQSSSITSVGNGWYLCTLTVKPNTVAGDVFVYFGMSTADTVTSYAGDITKDLYIWGADLRVANDTALPVYQRVDTSTSYDTTGFPMYLRFDGSDDCMVFNPNVSSLNLNMWAGARVLGTTNAASRIAVITGTTGSDSSIIMTANAVTLDFSAGYRYPENQGVLLRGADPSSVISYQRPSATLQTARRNGINGPDNIVTTTTFTSVTGRIGCNWELSTQDRYFNGRIYSLIVRGAATSDTLIGQTENWISGEMGGGYYPTGFDFLVDANGDQLTDASGNPIITQAYY